VICQVIDLPSFSWNFGYASRVLLLISADVHMPALPAKSFCFLLLLLCIEVSKKKLLICGDIFGGAWKSEVGTSVFLFFVPDSFSDERSF
jgi:hypothetical protein